MPTITRQGPERWTRDRRLGRRYPITAQVEYRLVRQGRVIQTGRGRTINISSSGVLVATDTPLPPGLKMELSIDWPARVQNLTPLQLFLAGRTVRSHDRCVAVRISTYDFRTRNVYGAGEGAF